MQKKELIKIINDYINTPMGTSVSHFVDEYLASLPKEQSVSDEDIDAFYPVKSETTALATTYIIKNEGRREGAKAYRDGRIKK
jgi:hypothetical protein